MPDSLQVDFPALLDGDEVLKEERFAGIAGGATGVGCQVTGS